VTSGGRRAGEPEVYPSNHRGGHVAPDSPRMYSRVTLVKDPTWESQRASNVKMSSCTVLRLVRCTSMLVPRHTLYWGTILQHNILDVLYHHR